MTSDGEKLERLIALCLLLLLFALFIFGARQLSFTFDEPSHLTSGYAFLARRATWTISLRGHPLLIDAWLALPFYLGDPDIPVETLDGWGQDYLQYVESFAVFLDNREGVLERSQIVGRTPAALMSVLLAALVYRWGVSLWGKWIGLLALATLVFDPTFLAHGRLATNDVGVATLGMLGLYIIWRWAQAPTWRRAAMAGVVLGLTMLAKGSGILWVTVGLGWAIWTVPSRRGSRLSTGAQVLLMGILALFIVWSMYGFSVGTIAGWPSIPLPAPLHWNGVIFQVNFVSERTAVAFGTLKKGKLWWYFPASFLIKNPLPLLLALPLAVGALLHKRQNWHKLQVLVLFLVLYVTVAITRGPNSGYRHMLSIHPALHLLIAGGIGQVWHHLSRTRRRLFQIDRWCIVALGVWYVVGVMRIYPHNLTFFNEMIGGPENGWRYLADSNTDWGQAWKALQTFRDERSLTFSYSGPEGYSGITPYKIWDRSLPPLRLVSEPPPSPWLYPEPGNYVISANTLSGLWLVDPDNFSWFRYHTPDDVIAHTLFYYHIDATSAPNWLMQCTVAKAPVPLDEQTITEGFEGISLRSAGFDCSQSWIYPDGGQTHGVYAFHGALLQPETFRERLHLDPARPADSFAARHLQGVPLAYRQSEYRSLPAFALYEWESATAPPSLLLKAHVAPADAPLATLDNASFHTAPLALDGPFTFLGAAAYSQEEIIDVETWWQVTEEESLDRPLSIMAHLLDEDGTVLGVADGLGVMAPTLQVGDILVHRHSFPKPSEGTKVHLRTGAYWLGAMDLWPVTDVPGGNALFVPLEWE